jgi:fluoroacetyl-CoA thioesterase
LKNLIDPLIDQVYTQQKQVLPNQTAASFAKEEGEQYASVLATPYLIAEMERVCADIIKPLLANNQVSVGAHIDIRHLAATAVGANYRISAVLKEHKWGLFTFEVESFDDVGKTGAGRIVRAIAPLEKIQQRADQSLR